MSYFGENMSNYRLAADIGASETKALGGDKAQLIVLRQPPMLADLPATELALSQANARAMGTDGLLPIQYIQRFQDGPAYALGVDALYRPNKNTKALPKRQLAVNKVLDLLGQLWERLRLQETSFAVDLAVLLPFSEYHADQGELVNELQSAAECFWYRGVQLMLRLETVKVVPEGAGLVLWRMMELSRLGQSSNKTFVVVMVGHRNLSFLLFLNGKPPTGEPSESSNFGFSTLIRAATSGFPVINPEEDPFVLSAILSGQDDVVFPDRSGQIFTLQLTEARDYYWSVVKGFLDEKLAAVRIATHYEVIVAGGAALQLRNELNEYFAARQRFCVLSWATEIQQELKLRLPLSVKTESDSVRLSDVYGLYKWLTVLTRNQGVNHVNANAA